MKRLLSIAALVAVALFGPGAALANSDHGMGHHMMMGRHHAMVGHHMMATPKYSRHRYGNDKARCRDAKGRFLKRTDARCLAR